MDSATIHHPGQGKFHQVTDSLPPQQITLNIVCVCVRVACLLSCATSCVVPETLHPRNMGTPLLFRRYPGYPRRKKSLSTGGDHRPPLHLCRTGRICPLRCGLLCRRRAKASGLKGLVFRGEFRWQMFKVTTFRLVGVTPFSHGFPTRFFLFPVFVFSCLAENGVSDRIYAYSRYFPTMCCITTTLCVRVCAGVRNVNTTPYPTPSIV